MFTLETLVFQLTGVRAKTEAEAAEVLMKAPSNPSSSVVETLERTLYGIRRENRIYGHYREFEVRMEIRCATHCGCIAGDLSKAVAGMTKVYQVWFVGGGKAGGIDARPMMYKNTTILWDYHVVTVLADDHGGFSIVDPLIVGSARPIPFAEWWPRFGHFSPMQFRVSSVGPVSGT
jgi:hypothetical protein